MSENILPSHTDDINNGSEKHQHEKITPAVGQLAARNHSIAVVGEFVGTAMFIMFSLGSTSVALQAANTVTGEVKDGSSTANTSNLLYIAFSFGASLSVAVFCFFRVSGGLFNPAVTFALTLLGGLSPVRGVLLFITQIAGALAGAAIADSLTPGPLYAAATLGGGASVARGFFIEFFMTATLIITILMLAVEKNRGTFMAPLGIGMALFICELFSVYYTGGALNPARAFAPCVVNRSFPTYHWLYWIAPLCGAVLACAIYKLLKFLNYQTNLGPDADGDGYTYEYNNDLRNRLDRIERLLSTNSNAVQV